ncbi:uncharacterized protein LOC129611982 [Condylostylus longicornis]|uniref:uncharacterized protein LOC129611982 n=1 Tax=Condylostylus longicornis TaxID=2530218 RepID=UPI00244E35A6|nr:uncharacterized protein LOC129611982 [Condylostylus longicornis]
MLIKALNRNELWALKVLDASGNPTSSFIYGQNFWVGSRTECERLNNEFRINAINPKNSKLSSEKSKFPMEYVVIFANYTDDQQFTQFGRHTVDIFFYIGAMILVYNFLQNEKQILEINENGFIKNSIKFLRLLLNRYIRLTPGLLLTMGLSHLTALYLKENSQYYISEEQDLYCKSYINPLTRIIPYLSGIFSGIVLNSDKSGKIGKFISHYIFIHLSKLTYMMYLLEPIVIYIYQTTTGQR